MAEKTSKSRIRIELTPEQQEQIRQATGKDVSSLEWMPEALDQLTVSASGDTPNDARVAAYAYIDANTRAMQVAEIEGAGAKLTAYPRTEAQMRSELARAPIHVRSFARQVTRCSLATCGGMCCFGGVSLNNESAAIIQRLAEEEAPFFRSLGLHLPAEVVTDAPSDSGGCTKRTAVAPRSCSAQGTGLPTCLQDTACVFLLPDGRCGLQVLSEFKGQHPWHYKPITCWLHPITIPPGPPLAIVLETEKDTSPDSRGFVTGTFCGQTSPCGRPAYEVLEAELTFLGRIIRRDLVGEIAAGL